VPGLVSVQGVKYTTARLVAEQAVDLVARRLRRNLPACRTAVTPLPQARILEGPLEARTRTAVREEMALTLGDAVLRRLDLVLGAIHHRFDLSRDKQTERLLRAMDHPCFSILAHPTARLIDQRRGCDFDLARVIRKARERGCFLELNAHPSRLDLNDVACRMAKDEGVRVSIASDAHSSVEFDNLRFGIGQARRGWL
jgi:hypothetical protein